MNSGFVRLCLKCQKSERDSKRYCPGAFGANGFRPRFRSFQPIRNGRFGSMAALPYPR